MSALHDEGQSRFDRRTLAVLVAAVLLLSASLGFTLYRLSLPTDGRNFYDEPGPGLELGVDRVLVAVEGVPWEQIVHGAVTLRPARPAGWQMGNVVTLTYLISSRESTGKALLRPGTTETPSPRYWHSLEVIAELLSLFIALIVLVKRPRHPVSLLLLLYATFNIAETISLVPTEGWANVRLADYFYPLAYWPTLLLNNLYTFGVATLLLILLLFPSPKRPMRTHPRRTVVAVYGLALLTVGNSAGVPFGAAGFALSWVVIIVGTVGLVAAVAHTLLTVRQPAEKAQARWLVWPLALLALNLLLLWLAFAATAISAALDIRTLFRLGQDTIDALYTLFPIIVLLLPVSLAAGIWRDSLFDVHIVVNRTLVYSGLTLLIMALYALVVGFFGLLLPWENNVLLSVLAAGLVALLFQPLRQRLQEAVNRMMYGHRNDPVSILAQLGQRLTTVMPPTETLQTIVQTVGEALKLPYVGLLLYENGESNLAAVYRNSPGRHQEENDASLHAFPLTYQGRDVGQLLVAPRTTDHTFSASERRLLDHVARQAGTAVYAARLTAQLQRSRARLVTAREEERRRIHRNLHDGLGPQLATLTLKADAARNYLYHNPQASEQLLDELRRQLQEAIIEIRDLVYDLRPASLDQLGLVPALQAFIDAQNGHGKVQISIEAPASLPPLPAAVEVAAYRIALEALTNVVRHAHATHCRVLVTLDDHLRLEVTDDGIGLDAAARGGIGLSSMQERAGELGGHCHVTQLQRGTCVSAVLPLLSLNNRP